MMMTHDKTLTEAGAMTIPEVVGIRRQLSAALARYEAAEAEVAQWRGFVTAIQERLQVALARVAELEAQLAAQQWRPVTEDWPAPDQTVPVRMRDGTIRWGYRYGDLWNLTGGRYSIGDVTHAYELPPAPQEPTP
jgi:hypothetical protein